MRRFTLAIIALFAASHSLAAQEIAPGFTRAQVEARLGAPAAVRAVGDYTYLFYQNGCEIKCGQHDLVVLKDGKVADAMFRSARRHYMGQSSAPAGKPHGPTERTTPIEPAPPALPAASLAPATASSAAPPAEAAPPRAGPGGTVFSRANQKEATKAPPSDRTVKP